MTLRALPSRFSLAMNGRWTRTGAGLELLRGAPGIRTNPGDDFRTRAGKPVIGEKRWAGVKNSVH